jgi:hypothetical protein
MQASICWLCGAGVGHGHAVCPVPNHCDSRGTDVSLHQRCHCGHHLPNWQPDCALLGGRAYRCPACCGWCRNAAAYAAASSMAVQCVGWARGACSHGRDRSSWRCDGVEDGSPCILHRWLESARRCPPSAGRDALATQDVVSSRCCPAEHSAAAAVLVPTRARWVVLRACGHTSLRRLQSQHPRVALPRHRIGLLHIATACRRAASECTRPWGRVECCVYRGYAGRSSLHGEADTYMHAKGCGISHPCQTLGRYLSLLPSVARHSR